MNELSNNPSDTATAATAVGTVANDSMANLDPASGNVGNPVELPKSAPEPSGANPKPETAEGTEPAKGFFGRMLDKLGSGKGDCNCGKAPGAGGRHKRTCPRSEGSIWTLPGGRTVSKPAGATASGHFGNVVLSAENEPLAESGSVVSGQQPSAPKNYAFYRRAAEKLVQGRFKVAQISREKKCTPVFGEAEAKAIAEKYAIKPEDLAEFCESIEQWAEQSNWPAVHPGVNAGMLYLNMEVHIWVQDWELGRRLKKIERAMAEQKKMKPESTAPASGPAPVANGQAQPFNHDAE